MLWPNADAQSTQWNQKWPAQGMTPYPQKNIVPIIRTESDRESDKRRAYIWRSCCAEMDSRALLFFSQLAISLVVLIFCIYEIAVVTESQWAKMTPTFIIGVWLISNFSPRFFPAQEYRSTRQQSSSKM